MGGHFTMNFCRTLLAIGFLLWDQNLFSSGQESPTTTNKGIPSPAPHSTLSSQNIAYENSSRTASNTQSLTHAAYGTTDLQSLSPDSAIDSREEIKLTDNSSAVLTPFTANITQYTPTDDTNSSSMQAPTTIATLDLTSPLTGTSGPSSSDFTLPASPPPMTVSSSPPGGRSTMKDCSGIEIIKPSYANPTEELTIKNISERDNITCDSIKSDHPDLTFTFKNYSFKISRCQQYTIKCHIAGCSQAIELSIHAPPDASLYSLTTTAKSYSANFSWFSDTGACNVTVTTICTQETTQKTFSGNDSITDLEPYSNYTCTSRVLYGGKSIRTQVVDITTDVGAPEEVQNLECYSTNSTITLTWDEPYKTNGPLNGYFISKGGEQDDVHDRSHTFKGLEPYKEYTIEVQAYNNDFNRKKRAGKYLEKTCRTEAGKPEQVKNVEASPGPHHNNEVTIKCTAPAKINGGVGKFILEINENIEKQEKCKFKISDLSYLKSYPFKLYYRNQQNIDAEPIHGEVSTRYNDKALIGFLAFLIVLTSLALIFVLLKIYKLQKKSLNNHEDSIPLTYQDDESQLLNIEPILAEHLLDTYKKKNADEGRLFLDEFQSIPRVFSKFPIKEARKPYNQPKNRYIDILPYDGNRVVLSEIHGEPGSDYINASYINGFKEPRKYIAAQGPKEETVNDFWKMIWEQKSTIIVMVTRCEEGNRNKCAQYWPSADGETEVYGDVVAELTEETFFPDYITRKLHVTHKREKAERDITHIQFTVWPDHGVPDDPNLLLKLRRRVKALSNFFSGPIVVHCSAGVGRTGTYISIDAMLEGLETEGRVDVYGYVVQLRRQRCLMVQVDSQYIFIHKALVKYNQFGETEISMPELPATLNNLKKKDSPSEPSQLMCEFQRLPSYRNWRPQTTGNHQDNKDKNRFSVVPYEFNRVQVKLDDEPEIEQTEDSEMSTDEESDSEESVYINASYIPGYWGTRDSIAAQAPLKKTLPEFWKMIFQKRVKAIVMLCGPGQETDKGACAPYWKGKSNVYDDIEVELCGEKACGSYTERCFEIRHVKRKDVRKVSQFHYEQWVGDIPTETRELLEMIEKIRKVTAAKKMEEQSRHDKSVPLVVHCSDGAHMTGTFCALWHLIESANVEGVIDVFQIVKNLRKQRSGIVSSYEQYEFLYNILASTVPVQNGQIKSPSKPEVKVEIQNELESNVPEIIETPMSVSVEESSGPKDDDTSKNGPGAVDFTEVSLRIDE